MAVIVQKSAFKPGRYRGKLLSAAKLRRFVEGTNKAIAAGVAIPALKKHSPLKADDKELERHSATEGAGWVEKLEAEPDGSISLHIVDAPDDIAKGIAAKTVKFTSPEFREDYVAPDGRYRGPLTRHWAFTPQPAAPDQGPLVLAMDDAYQFSDEDFEGPEEKAGGDNPAEATAKPPEKNPDAPPKATDTTKLAAVIDGLSQKGIVLPSDFTFDSDAAIDILIAAINSSLKAEQDSAADKDKDGGDGEDDKVEQYPLAFSDEELAALPEKARKAIQAASDLKTKVQQFSDEKASALKEQTVATIKSSKRLPPALKQKLIAKLEPLQFSDEGESPTLTIGEVATLIAESLPEQFSDDDTQSPDHPEGDAFFRTTGDGDKPTPKDAEKFAHKIHSRNKTAVTA